LITKLRNLNFALFIGLLLLGRGLHVWRGARSSVIPVISARVSAAACLFPQRAAYRCSARYWVTASGAPKQDDGELLAAEAAGDVLPTHMRMQEAAQPGVNQSFGGLSFFTKEHLAV
jgi:hypothetical protein